MSHALPLRIEEAFSVRDKVVLLTGAAGVIGRSVAEVFAANGAHVIGSDREFERLDRVAAHCEKQGYPITIRPADLTSPDDLRDLLTFIDQQHGRLDIVIHCGAIPFSLDIDHDNDSNFDLMFHTNVRSLWILARYSVPLFDKAGGGAFITFSSINGHKSCIPAALYSSTKAAVLNMSQDLSAELITHNIRFNTISPGATGTDERAMMQIADSLHEPHSGEIIKFVHANAPDDEQRYTAHPTEVAHVLIMLASAAGRKVNGTDIIVDGGHMARLDGQAAQTGIKQRNYWKALREQLLALPESAWKTAPPEWLKR